MAAEKLVDSNLANYGGQEHILMRQKTASKEKAWKKAGKKKGLQIWRIENFRVKPWPKSRYGEFYSGDSYIILNTKINDNGKKTYDVFFWLGAETTQDEVSDIIELHFYMIIDNTKIYQKYIKNISKKGRNCSL